LTIKTQHLKLLHVRLNLSQECWSEMYELLARSRLSM